jgi:Uncharacterized protein conserved in bacteria
MAKAQPKFNATDILELLAVKHSKDVFVPECKDGPTHYSSHMRMDAWAMNRSWAHPVATGYEIKVSRADFLHDNKWPAYLALCNQFYFVAPPNVIDPSELSADAGLMVVAGSRLLTKKKAPHRAIQLPEELYRYILMCRVAITKDRWNMDEEDRNVYWRKFVERRVEDRALGYEVSRAIVERVAHVETENKRLARLMQGYDDVRGFLTRNGFSTDYAPSFWQLEERIAEQEKLFPKEMLWSLERLHKDLGDALKQIEMKDKKQEQAA